MSKDLFMAMREQEIATNDFLPSKKEIIASSEKFAKELLDSGENNPQELFAQALRLNEALTTITKTIKAGLPDEDFEAFGLKAKFKNGGKKLVLTDDPIYSEMAKKLKERAELLKVAYNTESEIYDADGIEVPKVSVTYIKDSLTINY